MKLLESTNNKVNFRRDTSPYYFQNSAPAKMYLLMDSDDKIIIARIFV